MSRRILVIAEGERAERQFLDSMQAAFHFDYSFCCLRGNIYSLYNKIKEVDFNADVKSILLEMHPEYRDQLDGRFAYTYLVFDMDPHHTEGRDNRAIYEVIKENCTKLQEMAGYFIDETDPTIGKLYINYPMLESFRACDSVFDEEYKHEFVSLGDIKSFKSHVSTKKMARKHLKDYSRDDFVQLTRQNVYKLSLVCYQLWGGLPYDKYLSASQQRTILDEQITLIEGSRCVAVLNTSLFLILDYYGNRNGFYDAVIRACLTAPN